MLSLYIILMIKIQNCHNLTQQIELLKSQAKSIGFVPTMGALHEGHISLITQAKDENDVVVVSIFVNPTQFNNAEDLKKYPRVIEQDTKLLTNCKVDFVFIPSESEIYPQDYVRPTIDLGALDQVMEGKFRPGHFMGVVEVVKRLFGIVQPHNAYFGQKDFQQVAVIKKMTEFFQLPIQIIACPIIRSEKGLALSSRNMRLNDSEKEQALTIFQTLQFAKQHVKEHDPQTLQAMCFEKLTKSGLQVEYVEIVNPKTLNTLKNTWRNGAVCCIAAFCGNVRLIDNMVIN